jgi:hypothetical protein
MRIGKSKYSSRYRTEDRVKNKETKKRDGKMRDIRRDGVEGNEEQERYEEKDRIRIDRRIGRRRYIEESDTKEHKIIKRKNGKQK